jgi:excisionase family DNA binding protein
MSQMTVDLVCALRTIAEMLPPGTAVPVPRELLLELLDGRDEGVSPEGVPPSLQAAPGELGDRLLTIEAAAARLGVTKDWIYHHRKELPFAVKLGRRVLRFSSAKLERYLEARGRAS